MVTASPRNYPAPIFMGFCLKEYWPTPADWKSGWSAGVAEVCSAGDCIASRPPHWIDGWDFNRASCWNDEAAA